MFKQLKDLLPKEVNKRGFSKEMNALEIVNAYKKCCREILGKDSLDHYAPRFYKDKTFFVFIENSAYAQNFHMKQHLLLERINEILGKQVVKKFSIQIKNELDK